MKKILLFAVFLIVQLGFGQTSIWTNPITATDPSASNPYTTGQIVDSNIAVSGIGRGSGIDARTTSDRYDATGWNSGSIDTNDYFQFTITPNSGYKINLSSLVYAGTATGGGGGASGPTNYVLRSSIDGYTANIGTGLTNSSTVSLSGATFQNLTSAVTFRLYAWGASSGTRRYGIDNFTFNGTVVPLSLTPTTSVGTYQFCIDNTNTQNSSVALSGQFATVNIIKGYTYSFSVGDAFTAYNERLTLLDMSNNQLPTPITSTGASGASINNWIATYSGQVKVVLSNENGPNGLSGGAITMTLNSIGNTEDNPTTALNNTWRGHIYNWTGTAPPGGASPSPATPPTTNPFIASQYAGYYDVGTETIPTNFNFNGDTGCFNVFSNGTQRATIYPEQFAVRYRMKSTRPAGCYIVNVQGDDGVRLYIDNVLVFDEWEEQSPTTYQSILVYLDGDTDFILDYYENGGQNVVSFSITPFVSSSNSITAPSPSTVCSGVTPGVINGSSYTYNGSTINPTIKYQWQTATSASGPWSNVTTGTSGTAEDYTPAARTTTGADIRYYKRVVSATAAYASACVWDSNVISITTGANATPPTPTSSAATNVSCTSFTANWNTVAEATSYRLDVSPSSTFASSVTTYDVGLVTSFNVTGLTVGTTYYYRVRSFNGCSNQASGNSTRQTVTTANPSINAALSATSVCQGTTTTTLSYTATGAPTTYSIVWNTSPTNSFVPVTDAPITNPISVAIPTGTVAGTYTGTITVKNVNGCQSVGDTFSVIVNAVPTITTSGTIAAVCFNASATTTTVLAYTATTGSPNSYSIDWNAAANSAGLTNQANITQVFNSGSGNINITIPANVNPGTYSGIMTIGNGNCSATQNVTITVNPLPSTPTVGTITNVTCSSATGSVVLSGLPSGSWTINQIGTTSATYPGSGTTYTVTGLAVGSYTFSVKNVTCTSASTPNVPIADASSTTWDGLSTSWSNGQPDATKSAIVTGVIPNSPFSSNLTACALTISSGVTATVPSGVTLTITNAVTTNGQLIFENNASLVQTTNVTNTGAIEYRRISKPMKNFDFTYWSSPVTGQTAKLLSPNTLADKYFTFNPTLGWVFNDGLMTPGVGFIIRTPKPGIYGAPYPETVVMPYEQPVAFKGVPNNGDVTFNVNADEYNLVGNPYPSALDADLFMTTNTSIIFGALYFWTHNTAIQQSGSNYIYVADDYATYTLTGGVAATTGGLPPSGKIAAGQSFFVGNVSAGSFQFTNAMRNTPKVLAPNSNTQFFKQVSTKKTTTIEKNRVWLNLTNSQGAFKQLLVGYITGATNEYDNLYDGVSFDGQEFVDFYSVNNGQNLTIQGRALPFEDTDVVPLGYRSTIAGSFDISIENRDGALTNQDIWLEDKKTNTLHELSKGKYTFTAINGVENDRFVLKYTNKTLGTDDNEVADKSLIVSVKNKKITLTSSAEAITQVQVFDLLGRKVYDKSKINAQEWSISTLPSSEQTLIVKTTLANGAMSNKKIIY